MPILSLARKILNKMLDIPAIYNLAKIVEKSQHITLLYYRDFLDQKIFNLIQEIKNENDLAMKDVEAIQLYNCVVAVEKIAGDIAEVGSYNGASAKIICEAKKDRNLYLFDTFEGIPETSEVDRGFHKGQFRGSLKFVKKYLRLYNNVVIIKGIFPETAKPIENKHFSFVNLDVDIYQSTSDCLEFFYPRMVKGGIILSHDYTNARGVRKAFHEFFKDKPESIIRLTGAQCMIVKL